MPAGRSTPESRPGCSALSRRSAISGAPRSNCATAPRRVARETRAPCPACDGATARSARSAMPLRKLSAAALPVAAVERVGAADLVRRARCAAARPPASISGSSGLIWQRAAQREVRLGLGLSPRAAIRHRQRVVNDGRLRIEGQRLLEMLDGPRVVLPGERGAAEPVLRGHELRLQRQAPSRTAARRLPACPDRAWRSPSHTSVGTSSGCSSSARSNAAADCRRVTSDLVQMREVVRPAGIAPGRTSARSRSAASASSRYSAAISSMPIWPYASAELGRLGALGPSSLPLSGTRSRRGADPARTAPRATDPAASPS